MGTGRSLTGPLVFSDPTLSPLTTDVVSRPKRWIGLLELYGVLCAPRIDTRTHGHYNVLMITTSDLTESTGLSAKTLTRWHKRGIIPEPLVRTHPSGRGKMGYWPDWVLQRVQLIQELRQEGHSLRSAIVAAEERRWDTIMDGVHKTPDYVEVLKGRRVRISEEKEADLLRIFVALVVQAARKVTGDPGAIRTLAEAFGEVGVRDTFLLLQNGFNPVMVFDGEGARVKADFLVSHDLSASLREVTALVVVPLVPVLRKLFGDKADQLKDPNTFPAAKVLGRQGDTFVEYDIFLGGLLGFELVHSSARTVGTARSEDDD